jgi:hypothetical protein
VPDEPTPADNPTPLEMAEHVIDLSVGAATALMPLLLLAMPAIVLLGLVVIPLAAGAAIVALVGAIAAAPFLLVRAIRRGARR